MLTGLYRLVICHVMRFFCLNMKPKESRTSMIHITEKVGIDGEDYTIVITYDQSKIAPMTIYINQENNQLVGEYVYTIKSYTSFINSNDNTSSSIVSLNQLLNKKFDRPIYLNVNGIINDTSVVSFFRAINDLVI